MKKKTVTISLRVGITVRQELRRIARNQGKSFSKLLRTCVDNGIRAGRRQLERQEEGKA